MSILKLNPGDRVSLTVRSIDVVQGNYGPQYKFSGSTPDDTDAVLFLNVEPADKQLTRANLSSTSVIGQTIDVERVEKNGTKYTNIYRAGNGAVATQPTVRPVATSGKLPYSSGPEIPGIDDDVAPTKDTRWNTLFNAYDVCLDHALVAARKLEKAEIGSSPEAVAAMAATLLIQADRQGLTR